MKFLILMKKSRRLNSTFGVLQAILKEFDPTIAFNKETLIRYFCKELRLSI